MKEFRGFDSAIVNLFGVLNGQSAFLLEMARLDFAFTIVFLGTFTLSVLIVFGLTLSILVNTYKTVKKHVFYNRTLERHDYEMISFMIKHFKELLGVTKPKPVSKVNQNCLAPTEKNR